MADLYMGQLYAAKQSKRLTWLVFLLVIAFVVWAAYAQIDEVVVGQGKVIPAQRVQTIESLDGGTLKQVLVTEGQLVDIGQPLLLIDETRFAAAFAESNQEQEALLARRNRLTAELQSVKADSAFPTGVAVVSTRIARDGVSESVYQQAENTYNTRLTQVQSRIEQKVQTVRQQQQAINEQKANINALTQRLRLISREVALTTSAVEAGAVAEMELVQLQGDQIGVRGELNRAKALLQQLLAAKLQAEEEKNAVVFDYLADTQNQLDEVSNELAKINQSSKALEDRVVKAQLRSPVKGTVKNIVSRSIGGVVSPGQVMMEIVPQDDQLLIETQIQPQDIGFIRQGMPAKVKFTAFDFVIYGGLDGEVVYVSPDVSYQEDGTAYYTAHIKTKENYLGQHAIISGMQAQVDVLTGKKTILDYWLKPVLRAKTNAMREP